MPDPPSQLTSALADRYRIERELGEGGMASVFLAEDLKHDRKVAIKVLKPELAAVLGAERGTREVFVQPLSATDQGRWQVSTGGGRARQWSPDGRELLFGAGRARMAARVQTKPVLRVSGVERLFTIPHWRGTQ